MRLIGMLDSPYVRRVAISLDCLNVDFTHEAKSVFSNFEEFKSINPVVKAPTLICDDGEILMDSSLILQFVESSLSNGKNLWPEQSNLLQSAFRAVSLALAACDKGVQLIYERNLRPESTQYRPWLERVNGQLTSALDALEREIQHSPSLFSTINHASIASSIAWRFMETQVIEATKQDHYPSLSALSAGMENSPIFKKYPPLGPGVQSDN